MAEVVLKSKTAASRITDFFPNGECPSPDSVPKTNGSRPHAASDSVTSSAAAAISTEGDGESNLVNATHPSLETKRRAGTLCGGAQETGSGRTHESDDGYESGQRDSFESFKENSDSDTVNVLGVDCGSTTGTERKTPQSNSNIEEMATLCSTPSGMSTSDRTNPSIGPASPCFSSCDADDSIIISDDEDECVYVFENSDSDGETETVRQNSSLADKDICVPVSLVRVQEPVLPASVAERPVPVSLGLGAGCAVQQSSLGINRHQSPPFPQTLFVAQPSLQPQSPPKTQSGVPSSPGSVCQLPQFPLHIQSQVPQNQRSLLLQSSSPPQTQWRVPLNPNSVFLQSQSPQTQSQITLKQRSVILQSETPTQTQWGVPLHQKVAVPSSQSPTQTQWRVPLHQKGALPSQSPTQTQWRVPLHQKVAVPSSQSPTQTQWRVPLHQKVAVPSSQSPTQTQWRVPLHQKGALPSQSPTQTQERVQLTQASVPLQSQSPTQTQWRVPLNQTSVLLQSQSPTQTQKRVPLNQKSVLLHSQSPTQTQSRAPSGHGSAHPRFVVVNRVGHPPVLVPLTVLKQCPGQVFVPVNLPGQSSPLLVPVQLNTQHGPPSTPAALSVSSNPCRNSGRKRKEKRHFDENWNISSKEKKRHSGENGDTSHAKKKKKKIRKNYENGNNSNSATKEMRHCDENANGSNSKKKKKVRPGRKQLVEVGNMSSQSQTQPDEMLGGVAGPKKPRKRGGRPKSSTARSGKSSVPSTAPAASDSTKAGSKIKLTVKLSKEPAQEEEPQKHITSFFPVRRSDRRRMTSRELKKAKLEEMKEKVKLGCEDGLEVVTMEGKGRGVVATQEFERDDFVVEYAGDLVNITTAKQREDLYAKDEEVGCYMYYFNSMNKQYCLDATAESGKLGRLLNHSRKGNCHTKVISIGDRPYLVLVASQHIDEGEELTYDYGDRSKNALQSHPWLKD